MILSVSSGENFIAVKNNHKQNLNVCWVPFLDGLDLLDWLRFFLFSLDAGMLIIRDVFQNTEYNKTMRTWWKYVVLIGLVLVTARAQVKPLGLSTGGVNLPTVPVKVCVDLVKGESKIVQYSLERVLEPLAYLRTREDSYWWDQKIPAGLKTKAVLRGSQSLTDDCLNLGKLSPGLFLVRASNSQRSGETMLLVTDLSIIVKRYKRDVQVGSGST